jgi:uncharacterized membrane protein (DUF441 family)
MTRELALLLLVLVMGIIGRNSLVTWSAVGLIALKICGLDQAFGLIDRWGIQIGLTVLTVTVLLPFATGESDTSDVVHALSGLKGITALVAGITAAWLGARGLNALSGSPEIIIGVLVGTVIGTVFFKGMPVGPLVAVGMAVVLCEFVGS